MFHKPKLDLSLPPAILLGGGANALSVARNLRRQGIRVLSLGNRDSGVGFSRFCEFVPLSGRGDIQDEWLIWLTRSEGRAFHGAAIIACGDDGLEFIAKHRSTLSSTFLVYEANDEVLAAMLDKAATHALAKKAGIPSPQVWIVRTREEIHRIMGEMQYPCGLKPRVSHEFKKYFSAKLFVVNNETELMETFSKIEPYKLEMMLTELIPGGDRGYCSYYSYLDENGNPLFHFTKRKPRQYPTGFGIGTYHVTDWNPEVAALGLKFFQGIGLRGLACVEFKRDPRDGMLKLIECNHRVTEPNELLTQSGLDLATLVYNRLTKRPLPKLDSYRKGVCLAKPWEDVLAFRELYTKGELTWGEWLRSRARRQCFLYFKWWDPMPMLFQWYLYIRRQFRKISALRAQNANRLVTVQPTLAKPST